MEERVKQLEKDNLELKAAVQFLDESLNKTLGLILEMLTHVREMKKEIRDLQHIALKTPW